MSFSAVVTTGIYCRSGCGGRPAAQNVRSIEFAAAAEALGFRACLQCRPYRTSDPFGWIGGPDLVCRAVQLILDGALDHGTEEALARSLAVSARHLRRLFGEHVGATPDQLARSRRAHFARRLLDDTDLSFTQVAYASGFGSVRQFNRAMIDVFGSSPRELRARRRRSDRLAADGGLALRLPFRPPLDWEALLGFFATRAIDGVESVDGDRYRRTIVVDGDPGVIEVRPGGNDHLIATVHLPHWEGLIHHAGRIRRMFDLDVDPAPILQTFRADGSIRARIEQRPGLRVPGAWDPFELGVRAIVGQQISVRGARTILGRMVDRLGTPIGGLEQFSLTHAFPNATTVAATSSKRHLDAIGLPSKRVETIRTFAREVANGSLVLDRGAGSHEWITTLTALPGIGAWTAEYMAMRMGMTDAFPAGDLGLRRAAALNGTLPTAGELAATAEAWRPWRSYAAVLLWTTV